VTRAERRHHAARIKRREYVKRRRMMGNVDRMTPRLLGIWARTPCPCSCPMCGNARAYIGDTLQEKRSALCEGEEAF
jgi:hypothetical protein